MKLNPIITFINKINRNRYALAFGGIIGLKICSIVFLVSWIKQERLIQKLPSSEAYAAPPNFKVLNYNSSKLSPGEENILSKTLAGVDNSIILCTSKNRTSDSPWLIFNEVPGCRGEVLISMLNQLSKVNSFTHQSHDYRTTWMRLLEEEEQENMVNWFSYQHLPKSYDRHFYFVNFTFFQRYTNYNPIYINLIMDPVVRFKSSFKLNGSKLRWPETRRTRTSVEDSAREIENTFNECILSGKKDECSPANGTAHFILSVPFFCGQFAHCLIINNQKAIQRAKYTIEKYYSVVGLYENWKETLMVLEKYIPKFFHGAVREWREAKKKIRNKTMSEAEKDNYGVIRNNRNFKPTWKHSLPKPPLPEIPHPLRQIIETKLWGEVEVYRFVKQRLQMQFRFIKSSLV